MKDTWWSHNTDKLLLYTLVCLGATIVLHMVHHGDAMGIEWAEHSFDVVLGALILILTGRNARADGQTSNGAPPTPSYPPINIPQMQAQPSSQDSTPKS